MNKPLKKIYIEITNICNLKCSFCAVSKREKLVMSTSSFEHIAREIKPYTDYVYLHVKGEPLMHPHLSDILDLCEKYGLYANITTNGTMLYDNIAMLTSKKALRQVSISLHAETDNKAEYFESCIESAKLLAKNNKLCVIRLWNGEEGKKSLERLTMLFPNYFKKRGRTTLDKNIFLSLDEFWEWPDVEHELVSKTGTCQGLRSQLGILSDGWIVPCCLDGEGIEKLGNIYEKSFETIWNDTIIPLKSDMQNKKLALNLCQRCTYREKFK